jgi:uncharacterized protein YndB with AHSA1/START domain
MHHGENVMRSVSGPLYAILAILLLVSPPAGARVLHSSAGGFTLENTVTVPVDAGTAWTALVEQVDAWWPKDHSWFGKDGRFTIEPRAGGCFCEIAGPRQSMHMLVTYADPGRLLRMTGGLGPLQGMGLSGALEWRFETTADGTRITLHYVAGGYTTGDSAVLPPTFQRPALTTRRSLRNPLI